MRNLRTGFKGDPLTETAIIQTGVADVRPPWTDPIAPSVSKQVAK